MKTRILFYFLFVAFLTSCSSELDTDNELAVNQEIETRDLGCVEDCNYLMFQCRKGSGQEGESMGDFYTYLNCRCPEGSGLGMGNPDCEWFGGNNSDPESLNCMELFDLWADWQDLCYVGYTLCIRACADEDDSENEDADTTNTGPKGDCDGDGVPNGVDPDPGC